MRLLTVVSVCILACSPSPKTSETAVNSHPNKVEDIVAIGNVLDTQVNAWNLGNVKEFMKGYWHSDSLRFINKKGTNYGYDSVEGRYLRHYNTPEKMGKLSFSQLEYYALDPQSTLYNVTGKWAISGKDSSGGVFSLLFRKQSGEWKIIVDHTW